MAVLAGSVGSLPADATREYVDAMGRALRHRTGRQSDRRRAPVEQVQFARTGHGGTVALWQPWTSPDASVLVAWDGEIHNRAALHGLLSGSGTAPSEQSDPALIAALHARFGIDSLGRINGPFAVALVDLNRRRVILARDVLGVRPLHYTTVGSSWHFASEVQALLANPVVKRTPNLAAVADLLGHLHLSTDDTFFDGIRSVAPGHALVVGADGSTLHRFRDLSFRDDGPANEREATDAFLHLLRSAVRREIADSEPVAVALSGGIDSAALAAVAADLRGPEAVTGYALANEFDYTTGARHGERLPEGERCEAVRAGYVASALGIDHHRHLVRGTDLLTAIPAVVERFAAPHTSSFAPFLLAQRFRDDMPRLLSGLGADELLRGYGRSHAMAGAVGAMVTPAVAGRAAAAHFDVDGLLPLGEHRSLLHSDLLASVEDDRIAPGSIAALLGETEAMQVADAGLYLDFRTQIANEYLPTTDLSFGGHSMQVGLPFLDLELVEFVLSLPAHLRSGSERPKQLLRNAMGPMLPPGYLDLPKTGFALPVARWVDGPLRPWISDMLAPDVVRARNWFQPTAVEALLSRHRRNVERRSEVLWSLAMIETWARRFVDAPVPACAAQPVVIRERTGSGATDSSERLPTGGPAIVQVSAELGRSACTKVPACIDRHLGQHRPIVGEYIGVEVPVTDQTVASWIDLRDLDFQDYVLAVRRTHKGSGLRHAAKADRAGYVCERFPYPLHVPDIAAVNHSKTERSAGPMTARYLRTVDELGGAPTEPHELAEPDCPLHHDTWWGIFEAAPGHRQGDVTVDRRLVGYIRIRRHGTYALVSKLLGHGEHLEHGIMYRLLLEVMQWLCARDEPATRGIDHLIYANDEHIPAGLLQWKRKMQFAPALLVEPATRRARQRVAMAATRTSGPARVYVPLGENCLADDVVRRHGFDPVVNPYSYCRANLDYALQLESEGYGRLLDPDHLIVATSQGEPVVRNTAIIDCDPIYHPRHDLGFEFTHHDVIRNPEHRRSLQRKIDRLHDLRGRRSAWFFYHHRYHPAADLGQVAAKAERFAGFYTRPGAECRFVVFGQEIIDDPAERGVHRVDHSDRVVTYVFRTQEPWEGDNEDVFWARPDDDLFAEMFCDLGLADLR